MGGALIAFVRKDRLDVGRDNILVVVVIGPLAYAATTWLVPSLDRHLADARGFDLAPHHPLIASAFLVMGPIALLGALCGLLLVEDKEQGTLAALRVTSVAPAAYPLYRAALTVALTTLSIEAALAISPIVPAGVLPAAIPVAASAGLVATLVGLATAAVAANKVEALALVRAIGALLLAVPLIPYFTDLGAWEAVFGILPSYWPAKALRQIMDGGTGWPYALIGATQSAALASPLLRRLARR